MKKFFWNKTKENKEIEEEGPVISLRQKSKELSEIFREKLDEMKEELLIMKEKCGNLLETNYLLGLKHIENGNLFEATFRFRLIKKFWPQHYDSYYQLAYCLVLRKKSDKAKQVLTELMQKEPQHQQGKELLDLISSYQSSNQNPTT
ncbi:MAG: tetratricopeptide repeat protein [Rickettsiales bacterium]|nr:tetratricopeptide repeat protein [Rickettsiales bacterium]